MSTQNTEVSLATQLETAKKALLTSKLASDKVAAGKLIAQLNKLIEAESKGKKVVISADASESTTVKDSFNYLGLTDYSRESITTASSDIIYDTCIVSIIGESSQNCIVGVPTLSKHGGQNTKTLGCRYTYYNLLKNYMEGFNRTKSVEVDGKTQILLEPSNKILGIEVGGIVYTSPSEIFLLLKLVSLTNEFNKLMEQEKFTEADVIAEKLDTLKSENPVFENILDSEIVSFTGTTLLPSQVMEQYKTMLDIHINILNEDGSVNELATKEAKEIATKKLVKLRNKVVPIFEREMPKVEPTTTK